MAVAAAALTAPLLAGPAHADVPPLPLPVDVNCSIALDVTLSPAGAGETLIYRYGGSTSCSHNINYVDAWSSLQNATTREFVSYGPLNSCSYCDFLKSHGGPYGPVLDGTEWIDHYSTDLILGSEVWVRWPATCQASGWYTDKAGNTGYHDLLCAETFPFTAGAGTQSVTLGVEDLAAAASTSNPTS